MTIAAILLDIEGTTAPIAFVAEKLFPFAAAKLGDYVRKHEHDPDVEQALRETAEMEGRDLCTADAINVLLGWIKADKKATPLKTLQGKIWKVGYEHGKLLSEIYPDAAAAMKAWKAQGLRLDVYSSGSVEAQILLYRYSDAGDLTPLFTSYFDTRTGPKLEETSYSKIADEIGVTPGDVLFLSDAPGEVTAALKAGMKAIRIDRNLPTGPIKSDAVGRLVAPDFKAVDDWLAAQT